MVSTGDEGKNFEIEYLRKNVFDSVFWMRNTTERMSETIDSYIDNIHHGEEEKAINDWKNFNKDLVYFFAYLRIAGVDFDSLDFRKEVYKVLHHEAVTTQKMRRIQKAIRGIAKDV